MASKSKLRNKKVNVQPWFCDACARYGAVGLVPVQGGGSESPINDINASHRAVSPTRDGRHVVICAVQSLDLQD
jgi:hypothetical protein